MTGSIVNMEEGEDKGVCSYQVPARLTRSVDAVVIIRVSYEYHTIDYFILYRFKYNTKYNTVARYIPPIP